MIHLEIYHAVDPTFLPHVASAYTKVASWSVPTDDVENALKRAFRRTNSVEFYWPEDPVNAQLGLQVFGDKHRSTSVGDVIVVVQGSGRQAQLCDRFGWTPVDMPPGLT